MIEIRETLVFANWLARLRDRSAKAIIASRIQRMAFGNPGDVAPVGNGISELRIHAGPGYRVYFARKGQVFILLLCAGDKSRQSRDIEQAKALLAQIKETNEWKS